MIKSSKQTKETLMKLVTLLATIAFAFVANANEPATTPAAATMAAPAAATEMKKEDKKAEHKAMKKMKKAKKGAAATEEKAKEATH